MRRRCVKGEENASSDPPSPSTHKQPTNRIARPHQLFSMISGGSGSATTVGISSIKSSGSPECKSRVKPPISQLPSLMHVALCFLNL